MKPATSLVVVAGGLLLALLVGQSGARAGEAVRFVADANEVLARGNWPQARELADASQAAASAKQLIVAARAHGNDPRLLGRAQAALAPWWKSATPPAEVLLMRATLRQSQHDFDGALNDLQTLAVQTPTDPQVWLTLATVLTVTGRADEALKACARLEPLANRSAVAVCKASPRALRGELFEGIDALTEAASQARGAERPWVLSVLGELLVWANQPAAAAAMLRESLQLDERDDYTRAVLADLLLDQQEFKAARELVSARRENDALLLREVLASRGLNEKEAHEARASLAERIAAQRQRGDLVHAREAGWYALLVEEDPGRALSLATANFVQQREPVDARLLLEASSAARSPESAEPAKKWLLKTKLPWRPLHDVADRRETRP